MRVILISTYHAALASVVLDDRLRVLVEGDKSLLDGFLVVVSTARGLGSLQESLGHGGVGDLEVEDVLARSNCLLELLSLGNLTRITVNQETLRSTELLDHGLGQEVEHSGLVVDMISCRIVDNEMLLNIESGVISLAFSW